VSGAAYFDAPKSRLRGASDADRRLEDDGEGAFTETGFSWRSAACEPKERLDLDQAQP